MKKSGTGPACEKRLLLWERARPRTGLLRDRALWERALWERALLAKGLLLSITLLSLALSPAASAQDMPQDPSAPATTAVRRSRPVNCT